MLEDPAVEAPEYVHQRTLSPEEAPDRATVIEIAFERGDPVAIDGEPLSPASLLARLNQLGHDNGIGRLDLVENRFVGMKSRGVYETPGGTILLAAHRGIESITLDGGAMHLRDELMPRYARLIYNGFWFSPEREMLQALIDKSQEHVTGTVRMKLYKGNATVIGRESPLSLYDQELVTFEEGSGGYDQRDAAGFIRLNALQAADRGQAGAANGALGALRRARVGRRARAPALRAPGGAEVADIGTHLVEHDDADQDEPELREMAAAQRQQCAGRWHELLAADRGEIDRHQHPQQHEHGQSPGGELPYRLLAVDGGPWLIPNLFFAWCGICPRSPPNNSIDAMRADGGDECRTRSGRHSGRRGADRALRAEARRSAQTMGRQKGARDRRVGGLGVNQRRLASDRRRRSNLGSDPPIILPFLSRQDRRTRA